jgi:hypothetical protein
MAKQRLYYDVFTIANFKFQERLGEIERAQMHLQHKLQISWTLLPMLSGMKTDPGWKARCADMTCSHLILNCHRSSEKTRANLRRPDDSSDNFALTIGQTHAYIGQTHGIIWSTVTLLAICMHNGILTNSISIEVSNKIFHSLQVRSRRHHVLEMKIL